MNLINPPVAGGLEIKALRRSITAVALHDSADPVIDIVKAFAEETTIEVQRSMPALDLSVFIVDYMPKLASVFFFRIAESSAVALTTSSSGSPGGHSHHE